MAKLISSTDSVINTNMDKLMGGDGNTSGYQQGFYNLRIKYNGAAWVAANVGATDQASNVGLSWSTDRLVIELAGCDNQFTITPGTVAGAAYQNGVSPHNPKASAIDADTVHVGFTDAATGLEVTTEDTKMDFEIIISGIIGS